MNFSPNNERLLIMGKDDRHLITIYDLKKEGKESLVL